MILSARSVAPPESGPCESAPDAGAVPTGSDLRDGARPPPRRSGDGPGTSEPAGRLLRLPAGGEPRRAPHLEGADGLTLGRSPGADRRPGPTLGRADARRRARPDGRLHDRRLGERRAARAPRALARLPQRLPGSLLRRLDARGDPLRQPRVRVVRAPTGLSHGTADRSVRRRPAPGEGRSAVPPAG